MHPAGPEPGAPTPLRLAIVVGNEVLGRGLEAVLRSQPGIGTVRCCTVDEPIAAMLAAETFDAVIISGPDANWQDVVSESLFAAGTKVLALTDESGADDLRRYTSINVDGFLPQRGLSGDTIRQALDRCRQGEVPMPPALARALLAQVDQPAQRARQVRLTGREVEALSLLVRGLSNKQIARRLAISSHGAKRLVASIMLKLDSPNRTTAVVNAIRAGIVAYK